jgi:ribosomal protein S18 acetylase RimI-like enzyme
MKELIEYTNYEKYIFLKELNDFLRNNKEEIENIIKKFIKKITKKFTKDNIDRIIESYKESFGEDVFWEKENFLRSLDLKWKLSAGIYSDDYIYAMVYVSKYKDDSAHIHMLFVNPTVQDIGLRKMLLGHLTIQCKKYNIKYITIELERKEGKLYKFYEKAGFEEMNVIELKKYLKIKNRNLSDYLPVNKTEHYVLRKVINYDNI